jgi:beta-glucosidase
MERPHYVGLVSFAWDFDGSLMLTTRRFGTYSTSEAIEAGLDLEMPGPTRWRGAALTHAVSSNKVKISELDARVREVLKLIKTAGKSGVPENAPEKELDRPEDRELLREVAANAAVLLKNDDSILPFEKNKTIAVVGPNSKIATYCGGGSASLNAYRAVTPFDGISAQAQGGVEFAQGAYGHKMLPQLGKDLVSADGKKGFTVRTFNDPPRVSDRKPLEERHLSDANIFFVDYAHANLNTIWYAEADGILTPTESGLYDFGLAVTGTAQLFLDGKLLIDNSKNQRSGSSFLGTGTVEEKGSKELKAGQSYHINVQWGCAKTSTLHRAGTVDFGHGGLRFSGCKRIEIQTSIKEAAELAARVDQVVIFAGLSGEWESEGADRDNMDLPPNTDDLISHVLDANPDTVVVIQSGTPVAMPWLHKAKVVVQAWYGGNETGHGIADVIYGEVNPAGKLPLTFPKRVKDNPTYLNYRSEGGRVLYGEDVYVGYRYYEQLETEPSFAFGHGLSYTTFALSKLSLQQKKGDELAIHCRLENTGDRAGAEVVQVYIAPVSPPIKRPIKELKGFTKKLLKPGEGVAVTIDMDIVRATSFWDEKESRWCSAAGEYKILVGTSSVGDFLETSIRIQKTSYWNGL